MNRRTPHTLADLETLRAQEGDKSARNALKGARVPDIEIITSAESRALNRTHTERNDDIRYLTYVPPFPRWHGAYTILKAKFGNERQQTCMRHLGEEVLVLHPIPATRRHTG